MVRSCRRWRAWAAAAAGVAALAYCASLPFGLLGPPADGRPNSFCSYRHLDNPDLLLLVASCLVAGAVVVSPRLAGHHRQRAATALGLCLMVLLTVVQVILISCAWQVYLNRLKVVL